MHFHDTSPYLFQISDGLGIQWNGLSFMLALILSSIFMSWMVYRQRSELTQKRVGSFVMTCAIGALVGGRVGYCLFYSPILFLKFKADFPFWGVLALNEGGLSSFGSILGLTVGATVFAIRTGVGRLYLYDLMAITAPITIFFSRAANYMTGEFIGRPAPNEVPFAVKFPTEIFYWPQSDTQKLESLAPAAEKIGMPAEQWTNLISQYPTQVEAQGQLHEGLAKIVASVQQGSAEIRSILEPLLVARHPVQIYQAVIEGALLFFVLMILWYKPRRPGVVAATFLVLYSGIRIYLEYYRMPDPLAGMDAMNLDRTQWLAIVSLVIGLISLFIWGRRETLPSPGWGRGHSVKLHRR